MKHLIVIAVCSLFFAGCGSNMLMPCKTPDVPKAKAGKDELEYLNNVFIEKEQLREASNVCK